MADPRPMALAIDPETPWTAAFRFANQLVRGGTRVLTVTGELPGASEPTLARGTFIIPLSSAFDVGLGEPPAVTAIEAAAAEAGVRLLPVDAGAGVVAAPVAPVVVGLYGGGGAPFNQASLLAECGFMIRFISDAEVRAGQLDDLDVFVMPGGGFRAMHGQIEPLGEAGCRAIATFVERGGMYIGSCAGSYDCAIAPEDFVRSCPAQRHLQIINARVWNDTPAEFGALQSPGVGVVTVRNERPDHPVMYGLPETFDLVHYNGPIFEVLDEPLIEGASLATGLASFSGWTPDFTPGEAFAGEPVDGNETLLARAVAAGRHTGVAGYYGAGRVVAFGSHPEFGDDLPMARWSLPARMLANAVLWQATEVAGSGARSVARVAGPVSVPVGSALAAVRPAVEALLARVDQLQERPIEPRPSWLAPAYSLSMFGLPPEEIWRRSLNEIKALSGEAIGLADELAERVGTMLKSGGAGGPGDARLAAAFQVEHWLLDERPAEWRQDGGYQGVLALLRIATEMCDEALARWDVSLGPPAGAYAYMFENPYHLVVGSYLAAIGCVAGAVHLLRALRSEVNLSATL